MTHTSAARPPAPASPPRSADMTLQAGSKRSATVVALTDLVTYKVCVSACACGCARTQS
jgi:hypothetical protein